MKKLGHLHLLDQFETLHVLAQLTRHFRLLQPDKISQVAHLALQICCKIET